MPDLERELGMSQTGSQTPLESSERPLPAFDTGLKVFDLNRLNVNDGEQVQALRRYIERSYPPAEPRLQYRPADKIRRIPVVSHHGLRFNIGYIPDKPARRPHEDVMLDFFTYRSGQEETVYRLGFKGRPYGRFHLVFGTLQKSQDTPLTPEIVEVGLKLARVVGEGRDVYCNRACPSTNGIFHYQAMDRATTIWDNLDRWPFPPIVITDNHLPALCERVVNQVAEIEHQAAAKCDLLLRWTGQHDQYVLIPRKSNRQLPRLTEFQDEELFGGWGVMEMCGYFVGIKKEQSADNERQAVDILKEKYELALRDLAYP